MELSDCFLMIRFRLNGLARHIMLVCPVIGDSECDHLEQVVSARFLRKVLEGALFPL